MHDRPFPRHILIAIAALVGFTILAVALARITGYDPTQIPLEAEVAGRDIRFVDGDRGDLNVYDASTGVLLEVIPPDEDGFIRGLLRTLERERGKHGVDLDGPYRVSYRADGHFTLEDGSTEFLVSLRAFGATNEAAIGRFLSPQQPIASP